MMVGGWQEMQATPTLKKAQRQQEKSLRPLCLLHLRYNDLRFQSGCAYGCLPINYQPSAINFMRFMLSAFGLKEQIAQQVAGNVAATGFQAQ